MDAKIQKSPLLLRARDIERLREVARHHQLNARAVRQTRSLGDEVGLSQMGVHLVRVTPGSDTTEYHFHHNEEEFIYILAGRGVAEIGKSRIEVGPGDFMGFPAHSPPHAMSNPFAEDLVYLLCGERKPFDVCDYPRQRRRRYRINGQSEQVEWDHIRVQMPVKKPGKRRSR